MMSCSILGGQRRALARCCLSHGMSVRATQGAFVVVCLARLPVTDFRSPALAVPTVTRSSRVRLALPEAETISQSTAELENDINFQQRDWNEEFQTLLETRYESAAQELERTQR